MTPNMKDLGIDQMTTQERVSLALEIWESLGDAPLRTRLSAEQQAELARRNADLDANPGLGLTWEQIRAGLGIEK